MNLLQYFQQNQISILHYHLGLNLHQTMMNQIEMFLALDLLIQFLFHPRFGLIQDIGGISAQILELNQILDETKTELANLKQETSQFGSSLSDASSNLDDSVVLISDSVGNIEEGSSQLNALLFPVVASIAIILALQIVIIARRR